MDYRAESLKKHGEWKGKIEIAARVPVDSRENLSLAYTPGVAEPCMAIHADTEKSFELTRRWNTVPVITDGTAVLGLGDIGRHFPDTDAKYKDVSSMHLLTQVTALMKAQGYKIGNVDATLVMQKPKVAPFIEKMRSNIAFGLDCDVSSVNVKATTEEHLGFTGREEGASAHCVVLIVKE